MEIKLGITLIFLSWALTNIIYKCLSETSQYLLASKMNTHEDYPWYASTAIAILFLVGVVGVISLLIGIWKL